MAGSSRRSSPLSVRRDGRRRAAARAAALAALKRLRPLVAAELSEHDEVVIAAELTDAVLDSVAAQSEIGRPVPHTHV